MNNLILNLSITEFAGYDNYWDEIGQIREEQMGISYCSMALQLSVLIHQIKAREGSCNSGWRHNLCADTLIKYSLILKKKIICDFIKYMTFLFLEN